MIHKETTKTFEEISERCIEWMNRVIEAQNRKPFDEYRAEVIEDARYIIECIKNQESMRWIPITARPIDEEERKEYEDYDWGDDITHIFTCPLPDDGDEVLISRHNGKWVSFTTFCNDGYGVGDEDGNDWLYEVDAWMPLPKGYEVAE